MTINDAVAYRIRKLLRKNNFTPYKLERKSGIAHGVMDRILSGKNNTITLTTLYRIADGFELTILEFLDDKIFLSEEIFYE